MSFFSAYPKSACQDSDALNDGSLKHGIEALNQSLKCAKIQARFFQEIRFDDKENLDELIHKMYLFVIFGRVIDELKQFNVFVPSW